MKNTWLFTTIFMVTGLFQGLMVRAQKIDIAPSDIHAGQKIVINYSGGDKKLDKAGALKALVYTYDTTWTVQEVKLEKWNNQQSASITVPATAGALIVFIADMDENQKFYDTSSSARIVKTASGGPASLSAYAELASQWHSPNMFYDEIRPDNKKALALVQEGVRYYKDFVADPDGRSVYYDVMMEEDPEKYRPEAEKMIREVMTRKDLTENEVTQLRRNASGARNRELGAMLYERYLTFHPDFIITNKLYSSAETERDNKKKRQIIQQLIKADPQYSVNSVPQMMFETFPASGASAADWKLLNDYLAKQPQTTSYARGLNGMVSKMLKGPLEEKGNYTQEAEKYLQQALGIIEKELTDAHPAGQYPGTTLAGYRKRVKMYFYASMLSNMSITQYKLKQYDKALTFSQKSIDAYQLEEKPANEVYALALEKIKGPVVAEAELSANIRKGTATQGMIEQFRRLFKQNNSLTTAEDKYLKALQSDLYDKIEEEVLAEVKSPRIDAKNFTLTNIKNEVVNLSDYKGKVVILDFWATWCGPCKASFPTMQTAVNKFSIDKDVVFLFVNVWETKIKEGDPLQRVKDFIASTGYTFNVLYDKDVVTGKQFDVEFIPTKIVIDPNGRVAFKIVGAKDDPEEEIRKLETIIAVARRNAGEVKN